MQEQPSGRHMIRGWLRGHGPEPDHELLDDLDDQASCKSPAAHRSGAALSLALSLWTQVVGDREDHASVNGPQTDGAMAGQQRVAFLKSRYILASFPNQTFRLADHCDA